jgi:ligand-binding sensor domain-containing protein
VLLCFLLLLALLSAPAVSVRAERLPIKIYRPVDGLAHDRVRRIVLDPHGFLWFCTPEGLSRFDGHSFLNYGIENGLPTLAVNDLLVTRRGEYWIATDRGVCRYEPEGTGGAQSTGRAAERAPGQLAPNFEVHHVGEGAADIVNALYEDRAGRLWVGTHGGLFLLNERKNQIGFRRFDLNPPLYSSRHSIVLAIVEDREGDLWIGTASGLVRRLADGRTVQYQVEGEPADRRVQALLTDREGRIWLATQTGLIVFVPKVASQLADTHPELQDLVVKRVAQDHKALFNLPSSPGEAREYTPQDGLADLKIRAFHQRPDGSIWVGTTNGLSEFDGNHFRTHQATRNRAVNSIAEDRDGNLWFGTDLTGACKISGNGFVTFDEADGLEYPWIGSLFEDNAGRLFVVAGGRMRVHHFDGKRFKGIEFNLPGRAVQRSRDYPHLAYRDSRGQWWVPSSVGLFRFAPAESIEQLARASPKAVYTTRDGLAHDNVFQLFEDSRGDLWITSHYPIGNGLTRWDRKTETFHRFSEVQGLPHKKWVISVGEDATGNIWVGFYEGGLGRYRAGRFTLYGGSEGSPLGAIECLYRDRTGRLWAASQQSGVSRIQDANTEHPSFVNYTTAQGLSANTVRCITEDNWGRLYFGTARGVDRLDLTTGRIRHYTTADGLAQSEITAAFCDRRGVLWFGTFHGLSRFTPELERPSSSPDVLIGSIRVSGVPYPISDLGTGRVGDLVLSPPQKRLEINYFSIGFGLGETLRFQTKLEGADQDWSAPTNLRSINYANLAPRRYRFLVRAISSDGAASRTPAAIDFAILPPVWQRWWFLSLVAGSVALAIAAAHHFRVKRLIELERVRTRIATDLHDDIGSSLSQVSVLSEVIGRRIGANPGVSEPLATIGRVSRDLMDSMNDIVWAINPQRDHLSDLTYRMRRFASDVLGACEVEFSFQGPAGLQDRKVGADMRREVFLIFKETINNAARHAACRRVDITFHIRHRHLELVVRDDGKGFNADQMNDGNGLGSMRQRAGRIRGSLEITSTAGEGTSVRLTAPIGRRSGTHS